MPPSELHATFLPDHASPADGRLLFYGGAHPGAAVAELGLPPGDPVDAELYLDGELLEVEGVVMPVRPVLPALTRIASRPDITESVAIWARIANAVDDDKFDDLDRIAGELPAEGHSVPHSEGHVWTAKALVGAFVESFTELIRSDSGLNLRLITAQHSDPGDVRVNADLRKYQAHGIAWLEAAAEGGAGVILADDMGLGKTLQSIGLLCAAPATPRTWWSARPRWSATGSGRSPASRPAHRPPAPRPGPHEAPRAADRGRRDRHLVFDRPAGCEAAAADRVRHHRHR